MKDFPNGFTNVISEWLVRPEEANNIFRKAGVPLEEYAWDNGRAYSHAVDQVSSGYSSPSYARIRLDLCNAMEAFTGRSYSYGYVEKVMRWQEFEEMVKQKYGQWRSQVESIDAFVRDIWYPKRQAGIVARTGQQLKNSFDVSSGDLF